MIQLILLLILTSSNLLDQPPIIKNGKYIVHFDTGFNYTDYVVLIKDSSYLRFKNNDTVKGILKQIPNRYLIFKEIPKTSQTDTSKIGKILHDSFGDICFEIMNTNKNGFSFRMTYVGNLHITINTGMFKMVP